MSNCPEIGVKKYTTQQARQTQFMMGRPVRIFETDEYNKGRPVINTHQYITAKRWEIRHVLHA
jgi:hypothetical protein